MAGKVIWKGQIRFRSMDVPVKLHNAVREERIQFHFLHKRDHARLRQQMICAAENVAVPAEEQVRGYELEEGKYVLVEGAELEQTQPEESRFIEVHEFVKAGQIDPAFLERAYYLEADGHEKGYAELLEAMREMEVEGVCTWTMRRRAYFGALRVRGMMLCLHTLRYADEMISAKSLELGKLSLSEEELKTGRVLLDQLTGSFESQEFKNEHEKKLRTLVERKARGEKIAIVLPKGVKPTTSDKLLKTLQASLKRVA